MNATELESLFRVHARSLLRRATGILRDGDAAKDAVQEVFARALNARAEFPNETTCVAWLHRVATNLCLTSLRDRSRRRRILDRSSPRSIAQAEPAAETVLTVRALLRDVPDELQSLAVCYYVDEMSQEEIAAMTGIPRRTISYRLERLRSQLQAAAAAA